MTTESNKTYTDFINRWVKVFDDRGDRDLIEKFKTEALTVYAVLCLNETVTSDSLAELTKTIKGRYITT